MTCPSHSYAQPPIPRREVVTLAAAAKARRERQLAAKWAALDELERQARDLKREIAPLQRQVSVDQGYSFSVSRENLERALLRNRHDRHR